MGRGLSTRPEANCRWTLPETRFLRIGFSDPGLGELEKKPEKPGTRIAANVVIVGFPQSH